MSDSTSATVKATPVDETTEAKAKKPAAPPEAEREAKDEDEANEESAPGRTWQDDYRFWDPRRHLPLVELGSGNCVVDERDDDFGPVGGIAEFAVYLSGDELAALKARAAAVGFDVLEYVARAIRALLDPTPASAFELTSDQRRLLFQMAEANAAREARAQVLTLRAAAKRRGATEEELWCWIEQLGRGPSYYPNRVSAFAVLREEEDFQQETEPDAATA